MAPVNSRLGGKWKRVERKRGKGKRRRRWGVPTVGRADGGVRQERRRPGLFIGRLGQCPSGEIFLMAALIHHAGSRLTSSGHIAMVGTYPHAHQSALAATLVARHGGDHGAGC
jgi:hypothetical protein